MNIGFDEVRHIYTYNGDIASMSVTELLSRQGLAPDYKGVSKKLLRERAEYGTLIHKDIEDTLKKPKYEPTTDEGIEFKHWFDDNMNSGTAEVMLGINYKGMLVCGTADFLGIAKDGNLVIGDHKTTNTVNKEYVSWQVSLYDYFLRKNEDHFVNSKLLKWAGAGRFYCYHYTKDKKLEVIELDKIDDTEIEKLLECEFTDTKYQRPVLVVDKELQEQFEKAELELALIEQKKKECEQVCADYRERLLELFEKQGIKSWESADKRLKVTYVIGIDRMSVDSTKLKREYPMVYTNCQKITKVKPQIRIKVREGKKDDSRIKKNEERE